MKELEIHGNPGENNSFQENQISKVDNYYQNATFEGMGSASTRMGSYFQKLLDEIRGEVKDEVIDELLWYKTKLDGKKDMEEKLTDGGFRPAKIMEAKHFKEMYAKKALQYDCYPSVQVDDMKYPRLIFSDNMEDKGMEENRSRNFQQILVQRLNALEEAKKPETWNLKPETQPDYQVIFATSNIANELNKPEYTVGDYYTRDNKSLKHVN